MKSNHTKPNVLIISGGSGSESIQRGIFSLFRRNVNVQILTNCYDNGKSTGTVRRRYDNSILGPSDLRKNHLLYHKLLYGKTSLYHILSRRISTCSPIETISKMIQILTETERCTILEAVGEYFSGGEVPVDDFNIGNMLYAYYLNKYKNNISIVNSKVCDLLKIYNNRVLVNSYTNGFLYGITKSGSCIPEEQIVCWNNEHDHIVDIKITAGDNSTDPILSSQPVPCDTKKAIDHADLIILAPGTLWSSHVPTFYDNELTEALSQSTAKKYIVTNNQPDGDMMGRSLSDHIGVLSKYLDLEQWTVITNTHASRQYSEVIPNQLRYKLSNSNQSKHNYITIVKTIFNDWLQPFIKGEASYFFDYDGTLVHSSLKKVSNNNIKYFNKFNGNKALLTGNNIDHISHKISPVCAYTLRGMFKYNTNGYVDPAPEVLLTKRELVEILTGLEAMDVPLEAINIRKNAIVVVSSTNKQLISKILPGIRAFFGKDFQVWFSGNKTIEISRPFDKIRVINNISSSVIYVGDDYERYEGNDRKIYELSKTRENLHFFKANSVYYTNMLLRVLTW